MYAAVILATAAIVPGWALLTGAAPTSAAHLGPLATGRWPACSSPADVAAAVVRERMAAVLCQGAVGYGMALVFVLQGRRTWR